MAKEGDELQRDFSNMVEGLRVTRDAKLPITSRIGESSPEEINRLKANQYWAEEGRSFAREDVARTWEQTAMSSPYGWSADNQIQSQQISISDNPPLLRRFIQAIVEEAKATIRTLIKGQ